ncbi:MAG: beta-lactamase family protein [Acidobacteria bacterium]|nr:beta-lactamase family protein [Acidobacteriota bacterium]MBI3658078.1 beta-lactamase family protein [Acidobacteriota bacterium]
MQNSLAFDNGVYANIKGMRKPLTRASIQIAILVLSLLFRADEILAGAASRETTTVAKAGLSQTELVALDEVMGQALLERKLPGAVVLIGHDGQIVFKKAYGRRALLPRPVRMTTDTVFDLASLTKVVATAPAVLWLAERGLLALDDPVAKYIPEFSARGKARVTLRHLLTHYSGLMADDSLRDYRKGYAEAIRNISDLSLEAEPEKKFIYSDVNYILLAEIVRRVAGQPFDAFVRRTIFQPLKMTSTFFNPPPSLRTRCAPTTRRNGRWQKGQVQDERAYRLRGVAGHAGLFSTAGDLSRFAQMILNRGSLDGQTILRSETVDLMTTAYAPAGMSIQRGLGWDFNSPFAVARGRGFSPESFGHTGYTGTSIWLDPTKKTFLIILSNCVHPRGKSRIKQLRGEIADVVAAAIPDAREVHVGESKHGR